MVADGVISLVDPQTITEVPESVSRLLNTPDSNLYISLYIISQEPDEGTLSAPTERDSERPTEETLSSLNSYFFHILCL